VVWLPEHDLDVRDGKADVSPDVRSVLGNKATTSIALSEISLEKAKEMVEGIETIDLAMANKDE